MDLKQNNLTKKAMKVSSGALAALSVFSNSAFALNPNDILKKAKTMVVPAVVTTATATATVSVLGLTGVLVWKIPSLMSEKTEVVVSKEEIDKIISEVASKINLATKETMLGSFSAIRECLELKKDEKEIFSYLNGNLNINVSENRDGSKNYTNFFKFVKLLLREKLFPGRKGELSKSEDRFLNDVVDKIKDAVSAKSENKVVTDSTTKPSGDQSSDQQSGQKPEQKFNEQHDDKRSDQPSIPAVAEIVEGPTEDVKEGSDSSKEEEKEKQKAEREKQKAEEKKKKEDDKKKKAEEREVIRISAVNSELWLLKNEVDTKLNLFRVHDCDKEAKGFSEEEVLNFMTNSKKGYVSRLLKIVSENGGKESVVANRITTAIAMSESGLGCLKDKFWALDDSLTENNKKSLCEGLDNSLVENVCSVVKSIYEFLDVYCNPKVNGKTEIVTKAENEKVVNVTEAKTNDTKTENVETK